LQVEKLYEKAMKCDFSNPCEPFKYNKNCSLPASNENWKCHEQMLVYKKRWEDVILALEVVPKLKRYKSFVESEEKKFEELFYACEIEITSQDAASQDSASSAEDGSDEE